MTRTDNHTNRPTNMIQFPDWVVGPTRCKTRTFSVVLAGQTHGAVRIETAFPNRPVVKRRRRGAPGFYYGWE